MLFYFYALFRISTQAQLIEVGIAVGLTAAVLSGWDPRHVFMDSGTIDFNVDLSRRSQGHLGPYFALRSLRMLDEIPEENLYLLGNEDLLVFKNTPYQTALDSVTDFSFGMSEQNSSKKVQLSIRLANTIRHKIAARANTKLLDRLSYDQRERDSYALGALELQHWLLKTFHRDVFLFNNTSPQIFIEALTSPEKPRVVVGSAENILESLVVSTMWLSVYFGSRMIENLYNDRKSLRDTQYRLRGLERWQCVMANFVVLMFKVAVCLCSQLIFAGWGHYFVQRWAMFLPESVNMLHIFLTLFNTCFLILCYAYACLVLFGAFALEFFLFVVVGFFIYHRFDTALKHPLDSCAEGRTLVGQLEVFNVFVSAIEKTDAILEMAHEYTGHSCNVWLHFILIPLLSVTLFLFGTLALDMTNLRILTDVRDSHKGLIICAVRYIYRSNSNHMEEADLKLVAKKSLALYSDNSGTLASILSSISRTVPCPNLLVNGVPYPHGHERTCLLVDVTSDIYSELTVIEVLLTFSKNLRVSILSQLGLESLLDRRTKELNDREKAMLCAVVCLMSAQGRAVFFMGIIPLVKNSTDFLKHISRLRYKCSLLLLTTEYEEVNALMGDVAVVLDGKILCSGSCAQVANSLGLGTNLRVFWQNKPKFMGLLSAMGKFAEHMQVINNEYTNITISISGTLQEVQAVCEHLEKNKESLGISTFIVCDNDLRALLTERKVGYFDSVYQDVGSSVSDWCKVADTGGQLWWDAFKSFSTLVRRSMVSHLPGVVLRFAVVASLCVLMIVQTYATRAKSDILWRNKVDQSGRAVCIVPESENGEFDENVSPSFLEHLSVHLGKKWRVDTCLPKTFNRCVKESSFCLGVSNIENMIRVRILLKKRELSAYQLFDAHTSALNAFMASKNHSTYEWLMKTDSVSNTVDSTQNIQDSRRTSTVFVMMLHTMLLAFATQILTSYHYMFSQNNFHFAGLRIEIIVSVHLTSAFLMTFAFQIIPLFCAREYSTRTSIYLSVLQSLAVVVHLLQMLCLIAIFRKRFREVKMGMLFLIGVTGFFVATSLQSKHSNIHDFDAVRMSHLVFPLYGSLMIHSKYRLWNRIQVLCSAPILRKVICPYRPWALKRCCQQPSELEPLLNANLALVLLSLESFGLAVLFLFLFNRPSEGKAIFNPWEKLLVEVRKVNTDPAQRNVTWGPGLLAAETLVHRLKNLESQRGVILKNIAKRIGAKDVIRNITCWVQPGQLVTILGPRGCGKTVLLNLIAGRMAVTEGVIVVDSRKVRHGPNPSIGFLPDNLRMPEESTVGEFLTLFCALRGVHLRWAHRQIDLILKMFLMKDKKRSFVHDLTDSEKRVLAVCSAFVGHPETVLLDNPLHGLSANHRANVIKVISQLKGKYCTIIVTTESLDECCSMGSNRAALMVEGKFIAMEKPEQFSKLCRGYLLLFRLTPEITTGELTSVFQWCKQRLSQARVEIHGLIISAVMLSGSAWSTCLEIKEQVEKSEFIEECSLRPIPNGLQLTTLVRYYSAQTGDAQGAQQP